MSKDTHPKHSLHQKNERQQRQRNAKPTQVSLPSSTAALQRFADPSTLRPTDILALQQTVGNQAVQRLLACSRQSYQKTDSKKVDTAVVQRQEEGNEARIADLEQRVGVEEFIRDQTLEGLARSETKITANKEKVDKVGDYVKNSVIPWETKATHEIWALDDRVTALESASGKGSGP